MTTLPRIRPTPWTEDEGALFDVRMNPEEESTHRLSRRAFIRTMIPVAATTLGAFAIGFSIDAVWARVVRGLRLEREDYRKLVLGSFRIHHNVVGYLLVLIGLFFHPVVFVPMGLGMIVGHRVRDRMFWFIERVDGR